MHVHTSLVKQSSYTLVLENLVSLIDLVTLEKESSIVVVVVANLTVHAPPISVAPRLTAAVYFKAIGTIAYFQPKCYVPFRHIIPVNTAAGALSTYIHSQQPNNRSFLHRARRSGFYSDDQPTFALLAEDADDIPFSAK